MIRVFGDVHGRQRFCMRLQCACASAQRSLGVTNQRMQPFLLFLIGALSQKQLSQNKHPAASSPIQPRLKPSPARRRPLQRPLAWVHFPKCGSSFGNTLVHYANASLPAQVEVPPL